MAEMIDRIRYDVVLQALKLACNMLAESNIQVDKNNQEMLINKMNGTIMGYFLLKAEEEILVNYNFD